MSRLPNEQEVEIKYGKLPTKPAVTTPWSMLCVDLIGPYTLKGKDGSKLDFMCLTMINPATSWFEIVELPVIEKPLKKGGVIVDIETFDKTSKQKARLVNRIPGKSVQPRPSPNVLHRPLPEDLRRN